MSNATMTLGQAIEITGKDVLDYLDREASVPVVTKAGCQGDVSILRSDGKPATTPMPKQGVVIVRSEASSNTHSLHPNGPVFWDYREDGSLQLGVLTVPNGSTALMSHQEHGALEITPGTYRVGRQREFQGEWQLVRD
ncbi:hypothetical protein [Humibacter sp.]|uniref:hypothetical protein n=1 Tax=Humibacter sp. TaxID=1940291 RepID=UPI003F7FFB1F